MVKTWRRSYNWLLGKRQERRNWRKICETYSSYDKGIIACYPYRKMTGCLFANFIDEYFLGMFLQADKGGDDLFVQGNCPCQKPVSAKAVLRRTRANLLKFPAWCADVLCHENLFPVVARKLEKPATERQITRESYNEFEERVINTFYSIPIGTINKLSFLYVVAYFKAYCCNVLR